MSDHVATEAWAIGRLDEIFVHPDRFGGLEAVEMQVCLLLELVLFCRGVLEPMLVVGKAYAETHRSMNPMVGSSVAMWSVCGERLINGRLVPGDHAYDNLVIMLGALRETALRL